MEKSGRLETSGPGDYFGDSDFRGMAICTHFIAYYNSEKELVCLVDGYDHDNREFDFDEYENHLLTMCAKPTRENWIMLRRIAKTVATQGSAKLWKGTVFVGEVKCDGSIITFHE